MKDIFVSYASADKVVSYKLVELLEENGINCFIAPRDIEPGKAYASGLIHAINECKCVILVASSAINASEHVLNEVDVIVEKKKAILPLFIEEFEMNDDFRYYLGRKQWVFAFPGSIETYISKIIMALEEYITLKTRTEVREAKDDNVSKTVFEYNPDRGIMINPEDHQRNVSFRNDTLINLLGGIYEKIINISDEKTAEEIFYSSGYVSGKNFAERISNQWDAKYSLEGVRQKFDNWCKFDSAVGWGKFGAEIDYDEEHKEIVGKIIISEAFIVDRKHKKKICSFIRGYCSGVAQTLLNTEEVSLECSGCPLENKFSCRCIFDLKAKG